MPVSLLWQSKLSHYRTLFSLSSLSVPSFFFPPKAMADKNLLKVWNLSQRQPAVNHFQNCYQNLIETLIKPHLIKKIKQICHLYVYIYLKHHLNDHVEIFKLCSHSHRMQSNQILWKHVTFQEYSHTENVILIRQIYIYI